MIDGKTYDKPDLVLEGKPVSTNTLYRIGKNGIYMTDEGKAMKALYSWKAKEQWKKPIIEHDDIFLMVHIFFGNKHTHDWDNYSKILSDSLQGIVYHDDNQVKQGWVRKDYDKERPRIEVFVIEGDITTKHTTMTNT